ncbi:MAG: DNA methyltransferase, partial [Thermoplasmata archaeon]
PTSFPVELPERCLRLHGRDRISLALDPFVGIGGSALAALRVGVPFVGYDIDPAYLIETARLLERAGAVRVEEGSRSASRGVDRAGHGARARSLRNRGRRPEAQPTPGVSA